MGNSIGDEHEAMQAYNSEMTRHRAGSVRFSSSDLFKDSFDWELLKMEVMKPDFDATKTNRELLLQLSVRFGCIDVAQLLIENGAVIDDGDGIKGFTPLHLAVLYQQYDAACMLLYYGASVEVKNCNKETPFMLALKSRYDVRCAELLFDYVVDFEAINKNGQSILYLAAMHKNPLTENIVAKCTFNHIVYCLKCSLYWRDIHVFIYLFPRVNHAQLVREYGNVMEILIGAVRLRKKDFLECFWSILSSEYASKFVQEYTVKTYLHFLPEVEGDVESSLYLLFSVGTDIVFNDFSFIYQLYGFDEELEVIFEIRPNIRPLERPQYFDYGFSVAYIIFFSYSDHINNPHSYKSGRLECLKDYLKFFTVSAYHYREYCDVDYDTEVVQKINERGIPSLREVSRDVIRKAIVSSTLTRGDMYKVYDAIRSLPVPKIIQDMLLLKRPLYN